MFQRRRKVRRAYVGARSAVAICAIVLFGGAQELGTFFSQITGVANQIGIAVQATSEEPTKEVKKYGNDN